MPTLPVDMGTNYNYDGSVGSNNILKEQVRNKILLKLSTCYTISLMSPAQSDQLKYFISSNLLNV